MLCDSEAELQPSPSYLEDRHGQRTLPDLYLEPGMRRTAAGWLVEVAAEFGLHQETLFLGTALLDRFLSAARVRRRHAGTSPARRRGPLRLCSSYSSQDPERLPCRVCRVHSCSWWAWPACSSPLSTKRYVCALRIHRVRGASRTVPAEAVARRRVSRRCTHLCWTSQT